MRSCARYRNRGTPRDARRGARASAPGGAPGARRPPAGSCARPTRSTSRWAPRCGASSAVPSSSTSGRSLRVGSHDLDGGPGAARAARRPAASRREAPGRRSTSRSRARATPEIFVAGDAADLPTPLAKQGYHALDMGACAARNAERLLAGQIARAVPTLQQADVDLLRRPHLLPRRPKNVRLRGRRWGPQRRPCSSS